MVRTLKNTLIFLDVFPKPPLQNETVVQHALVVTVVGLKGQGGFKVEGYNVKVQGP